MTKQQLLNIENRTEFEFSVIFWSVGEGGFMVVDSFAYHIYMELFLQTEIRYTTFH